MATQLAFSTQTGATQLWSQRQKCIIKCGGRYVCVYGAPYTEDNDNEKEERIWENGLQLLRVWLIKVRRETVCAWWVFHEQVVSVEGELLQAFSITWDPVHERLCLCNVELKPSASILTSGWNLRSFCVKNFEPFWLTKKFKNLLLTCQFVFDIPKTYHP